MRYLSGIHPVFTLWFPAALLLLQAGFELFMPDELLSAMLSENGIYEILQFLVALFAAIFSFLCLLALKRGSDPFLFGWVLCFFLGCVYIAGEEISWGQHFAEWATPEFWGQVNDQNETNLHNTSSWLDQKPRLILLIGIVVGGLIFPLLARFRPGTLPGRFKIIYPPLSLFFVAFGVLAIELLEELDKALKDVVIMARSSEVQELLMFYFVLLYLVSLRSRILQDQR